MRFTLLSKIGAVLAVIGVIGYVVIFPSVIAKDGQDFVDQFSVDANGVETFGDMHSIAFLVVDEPEMKPLRDALKPHRGQVYSEN